MIELKRRPSLKWYGWVVCTFAALFYCYEFLLRIQPGVMVPQLMHNFQIDASGLGILSAMYYWAYTPLQAIVGLVTDYYGPRRVLIGAIFLCIVGSLFFGLTHNLYVAAFGRFLTGFGSAFAFIGVLKLASMWLPHNRFALFAGITTALGMLGAITGDIDMAWAVQNFGWERVVLASVLIGAILLPLFLLFVHERDDAGLDGNELNLHQTFRGLLQVVRNRQVILSGVIGCMLYLSLSAFAVLWGVSFVRVATHLSLVQAAEINSMVFFGWLVGSPLHGWLTDRIQKRRPQLIASSFAAAIVISVVLIWPHMPESLLFILLFLFGLFSSVEVLCFAVARDVTKLQLVATAMAIVNCLIMLGGMLVQPLVGIFMDVFFPVVPGHEYSLRGFQLTLIIVPVGMLLAGILACFMRETYRDEERSIVESR